MPNRKKSKALPAMDTEYQDKRQRNNEAVRKSRAKARQKAQEIQGRIEKLRHENEQLESRKKLLAKELSFFKDLFIAYTTGGDSNDGGSQLDESAVSALMMKGI